MSSQALAVAQKQQLPAPLQLSDAELLTVLRSSLYPGAKDESIKLVIGYCRAQQLDPMQKPVHIVPMSVKVGDDYQWRDVIMPGIGLYRTQAARTGQFAGVSEPEFGPEVTEKLGGVEVTYPQWCKVTVRRALSNGQVAEFTAIEYWKENYATKKRDTTEPNAMWRKRSRGQIAKCAEAQALRKAFPEMIGAAPTAEEMEGKTIDDSTVIEGSATAVTDDKPSVKQPASKSEGGNKTTPKPTPETSGPITESMKRVIMAQLKNCGVPESDMFFKFEVESWDGLKASQANQIIGWIKNRE